MRPELPHEELLSAYLDGESTPAERAEVTERLAHDDAWRAALQELQFARDAVRTLPWRAPPVGFLDRLLELPAPQGPRRQARVAAALGAVAAAIVGLALATSPAPDTTPITPQVSALSDTHGATSSLEAEPVSNLAPVAVPVTFTP